MRSADPWPRKARGPAQFGEDRPGGRVPDPRRGPARFLGGGDGAAAGAGIPPGNGLGLSWRPNVSRLVLRSGLASARRASAILPRPRTRVRDDPLELLTRVGQSALSFPRHRPGSGDSSAEKPFPTEPYRAGQCPRNKAVGTGQPTAHTSHPWLSLLRRGFAHPGVDCPSR